ncbi:MAG TPA: enoyl-CoA hydratase-related protein [Galbitalea sp.]|jgi:enoyl-CoA hydratase
MSTEQCVTYETEGRLAFITLNRPEVRNALNGDLLRDFNTALDAFQDDDEPRVGILRANGPTFCAGFDLTQTSASVAGDIGPWEDRGRLLGWINLAIRIWEFPRPIIAQVQGHCLAGGILLPMACDIVFISETCAVGWPRLPVGGGFMDGAMSLLVGQRRAKEISYIVGSRITGRQAADWGYANVAVPAGDLERETLAFARRVAKTPRNILEIRKAAITRASMGLSFRDALLAGVEWDVIAHVDPSVVDMKRLVRENGMKTVIGAFENTDDPFAALQSEKAAGDS